MAWPDPDGPAEDVLDGLLLAVNHSGDSDSTGAITGNILGTILGEQALPSDLLECLELRAAIT
jgi:ADP-ribosylglycohydrolase